jgi:hydrogenase maturation protease
LKTLVLGLGNPILTDDGVGIHVVRALATRLNHWPDAEVAEASLGGLRLLEAVTGYERVILIDAIQTREGKAGEVYQLAPADFQRCLHVSSSHDLDFGTALKLGEQMGFSMPQEIVIFAVEVEDVLTFGEQCTPQVQAAIPSVVEAVLAEIRS